MDHPQVNKYETHQGWNGMKVKITNNDIAAIEMSMRRAHEAD
jgi:hypothetical protein